MGETEAFDARVQLYGHWSRLRFKWTCQHCRQRNDSPLPQPFAAIERFGCVRCRRVAAFRVVPPNKTEVTL